MKEGNITRHKFDPAVVAKADWSRLDAMSDAELEAAARSDPDAQPLTEEQLSQMKRGPNPRVVRFRLGLTQEEFAKRFHLPLGTIRDWEQSKHEPDSAAKVLLRLIDRDPQGIAKALAG